MKFLRALSASAAVLVFLGTLSATGADPQSPSANPTSPVQESPGNAPSKAFTVAAYYFPNYHPGDARNNKKWGRPWSEWELVRAATPRFPGHQQPNVPMWGETDESDPKAMAQKIDAAADHGINAFIFDWYYYDDGPFLNKGLDEGFLGAPNNQRLKFALMWANHDWLDIFPYTRPEPPKRLYPGRIKPETFETICRLVIEKYFKHPSYWTLDGKPYFSFYELNKLTESFGSIEATRTALDRFRQMAREAGLPGLHLNAVVWGQPILPGESTPVDAADLVKRLGFDSVTSYVWIHHVPLNDQKTDFVWVQQEYGKYWEKARGMFGVPYFPNVSMGWDASPRTNQSQEFGNTGYPFTNTISGNTPECFQNALAETKKKLTEQNGPYVITVNSWNEWTEGSYLEPDTRNGMKYLEAVEAVFKTKAKPAAK